MDKQAKTRIVTGCVLAAVSLFAALSLFSWTISWWRFGGLERSDGVLTEFNMPNWCGPVGSWFASGLTESFGGPAAFFALGLAVLWSYLLLSSKAKFSDAILKIFGSVVFVVSVSALTALAGSNQVFVSTVGLAVSALSTSYFGVPGAYLLLLLASVLSLLLATDFLVVAPAGQSPRRNGKHRARRVGQVRRRPAVARQNRPCFARK